MRFMTSLAYPFPSAQNAFVPQRAAQPSAAGMCCAALLHGRRPLDIDRPAMFNSDHSVSHLVIALHHHFSSK